MTSSRLGGVSLPTKLGPSPGHWCSTQLADSQSRSRKPSTRVYLSYHGYCYHCSRGNHCRFGLFMLASPSTRSSSSSLSLVGFPKPLCAPSPTLQRRIPGSSLAKTIPLGQWRGAGLSWGWTPPSLDSGPSRIKPRGQAPFVHVSMTSGIPHNLTIQNQPSPTGVNIPRLGLGTFQVSAEATEASVKSALALGYHHVDTASIYKNEQAVGKAIRDSGVPRGDVFVTTKLWTTDFGHDKALKGIDASLEALGLEYVDMYLIHIPPPPELRLETWGAMEKILSSGKARAVGVCNYGVHHLEELLAHCTSTPAVNQVELHPFFSKPGLVSFCQDKGIALEAFSPLTRGQKLHHPLLLQIAGRYSKSTAQVLIRWGLQKGFVVLPKSVTPARIAENGQVFDFEISPEDMLALDALNENYSAVGWDPTAAP